MADIFEQVDDELRQDRMHSLWRRWGWMVVAGAVIIVAGTAAVVGWRAYEEGAAEDETRALNETVAAAAEAEPEEAVAALTAYADGAEPNFAALARLRAGAHAVQGDDAATAITLYDAVAADADVDPVLRDLATVLSAALSADSADFDALRGRLAALEAANSPWRFLANEIMAAAAIRAGDMATAEARLTAISDDPDAPNDLRRRAAELLSAIGAGETEASEGDGAPDESTPDDGGASAPAAEDPEGAASPTDGASAEGSGAGTDDGPAEIGDASEADDPAVEEDAPAADQSSDPDAAEEAQQ